MNITKLVKDEEELKRLALMAVDPRLEQEP